MKHYFMCCFENTCRGLKIITRDLMGACCRSPDRGMGAQDRASLSPICPVQGRHPTQARPAAQAGYKDRYLSTMATVWHQCSCIRFGKFLLEGGERALNVGCIFKKPREATDGLEREQTEREK